MPRKKPMPLGTKRAKKQALRSRSRLNKGNRLYA